MPPLRCERRGGRAGRPAAAARSPWRRRSARRLDGVIRIARASGSCSACAIRSAAIHAGVAGGRDHRDLARAGKEIDRAVGRDQRLGGGDVGVAGADDLVDARNGRRCRRRAPRSHARRRSGTSGDTPASSAANMTVGSGRGQTAITSPHAGDARRNRGHQQRRRQRIASARNVAADAIERRDALRDANARASALIVHARGTWRPATRADVAPRRSGSRASLPEAPSARRLSISAAVTSIGPSSRSNLRAYASSARSPSRRTRSTIARHGAIDRRDCAPAVDRSAPTPPRRRWRGRSEWPESSADGLVFTARSCSADTRRCPAPAPPSAAESGRARCALR